MDEIVNYKVTNAVESVSTDKNVTYKADNTKFHVALLDFGLKENIMRELVKRDCDVTICPYNTDAEQIKAIAPDGIMLSNGPGDPADNPTVIKNLSGISKLGVPIFGICLGHQLMALANGFKTSKLKYGHRGANQPVKNLTDGRVFITSQNHGYAVVSDSIDKTFANELFVNVNDKTNEGIEYTDKPVYTVQFHPEACGGPQDTAWLFDKFIKMMEGKNNAAR